MSNVSALCARRVALLLIVLRSLLCGRSVPGGTAAMAAILRPQDVCVAIAALWSGRVTYR